MLCDACKDPSILPGSRFEGYMGSRSAETGLMVIGHFADSRLVNGNWLYPFSKSMTGMYFQKVLSAAGLDLEDIFFTNAFKCLTSSRITPPGRVHLWRCIDKYLIHEIEDFKPNLIVSWGVPVFSSLAAKAGKEGRLSLGSGFVFDFNGAKVFSMYHPCYEIRWVPQRDMLAENFAKVYRSRQ